MKDDLLGSTASFSPPSPPSPPKHSDDTIKNNTVAEQPPRLQEVVASSNKTRARRPQHRGGGDDDDEDDNILAPKQPPASLRLLDFDGLRAKGIPLSKTQIWRLIRNKKFPAPIKVGASKNAWIEAEIDALIQQRVEERDNAAA